MRHTVPGYSNVSRHNEPLDLCRLGGILGYDTTNYHHAMLWEGCGFVKLHMECQGNQPIQEPCDDLPIRTWHQASQVLRSSGGSCGGTWWCTRREGRRGVAAGLLGVLRRALGVLCEGEGSWSDVRL